MPVRLFFCLILLAVFSFLTACSSDDQTFKFAPGKASETPLFVLHRFGDLIDSPVNSPEIFNREALKTLGISKITIYSKGGKNPEDTLQRFSFTYNENWTKLNYRSADNNESHNLVTRGTVTLTNDFRGDSEFDLYFGVDKKFRADFITNGDTKLIIKSKSGNRKDTTTFYGSFNSPSAIVQRVGQRILSVELFMAAGSSSKDIRNAFSKLKINKEELLFSEFSVTFTENNKPLENYLLDENFAQINLQKSWKYDSSGNITEYNEWNGSNLLKTIVLRYTKNDVPDFFSMNSKTYYIHYN